MRSLAEKNNMKLGISALTFLKGIKVVNAEIAQVVERRPEKPGVASASLALGTLLRSNTFVLELRSSKLLRTLLRTQANLILSKMPT